MLLAITDQGRALLYQAFTQPTAAQAAAAAAAVAAATTAQAEAVKQLTWLEREEARLEAERGADLDLMDLAPAEGATEQVGGGGGGRGAGEVLRGLGLGAWGSG